jgi:hypothetical protein
MVAMLIWWLAVGALIITISDTSGPTPILDAILWLVLVGWPLGAAASIAGAVLVRNHAWTASRLFVAAAFLLGTPFVIPGLPAASAAAIAVRLHNVEPDAPAPNLGRLVVAGAAGLLIVAALLALSIIAVSIAIALGYF